MKTLSLLGAAVLSGAVLVISAAWSLSALGAGPGRACPFRPRPVPLRSAARSTSGPTCRATKCSATSKASAAQSPSGSGIRPNRPTRRLRTTCQTASMRSSSRRSAYRQGSSRLPTQDDAPLAETGGKFPVLVFSHGSGSLLAIYTAMLSEIASHGYVVVGIQHPYNAMMTTFADGRTIPASPAAANDTVQYWSEDTAFVVDELEKLAAGTGKFGGRLDLSRLGAFGHSFGGAASAEFCLDDARCVAGINFDGSLSGDVETGRRHAALHAGVLRHDLRGGCRRRAP